MTDSTTASSTFTTQPEVKPKYTPQTRLCSKYLVTLSNENVYKPHRINRHQTHLPKTYPNKYANVYLNESRYRTRFKNETAPMIGSNNGPLKSSDNGPRKRSKNGPRNQPETKKHRYNTRPTKLWNPEGMFVFVTAKIKYVFRYCSINVRTEVNAVSDAFRKSNLQFNRTCDCVGSDAKFVRRIKIHRKRAETTKYLNGLPFHSLKKFLLE